MSNAHTNQHFVPKCYLKGFSFGKDDNPKVYVYDKMASKAYITPTKKICFEPDLYTIKDIQLSEDERRNYYEVNYLKKEVEDSFGPCLGDIISKLSKGNILSVKDKIELSHYIAIQYLRHPYIKRFCPHLRNGLFSNIQESKEIVKEFENNDITILNYFDDDSKAHFTNAYGNEGSINQLTCLFGLSKWTILYSPSHIQTSDNPVLVVPEKFEIHTDKVVLNTITSNFAFPINNDYLITIDINPNASFEDNNKCIIREATDKEVLRYNLFQYLFANRYLINNTPFQKEIEYINIIQKHKTIIYE